MWTDAPGQLKKNDAVAADPHAIHRGGALYLDTATLRQTLVPWTDGSGDSLTLDFVLPGALENITTTPVGWEGDVAGSTWRAGVADLDGVKGGNQALATALAEHNAPGAQSYVRIPFGEVVDQGGDEWRPVEKQFGGNWQDFSFAVQPMDDGEYLPDSTIPDYVRGSIAIYHAIKKHDFVGGAKYMAGKAAHLPRPMAVGFRANQTTITGWCFGRYEFDNQTGRVKKVFPASAILGWAAQTATVVVDTIVGYDTFGASQAGWTTNHSVSMSVLDLLDGDYIVDSITSSIFNPASTPACRVGIYDLATPNVATVTEHMGPVQAVQKWTSGDKTWQTHTLPGANPVTFASTKTTNFCFGSSGDGKYWYDANTPFTGDPVTNLFTNPFPDGSVVINAQSFAPTVNSQVFTGDYFATSNYLTVSEVSTDRRKLLVGSSFRRLVSGGHNG